MQFEEEIIIKATPEKVFSVYADVDGWSKWDPDTKSSSVEGLFCSGARGIIRPTIGPAMRIHFTEVIPNQSFTAEIRLPLCVIRFDHELYPAASGTRTLYRVVFSGLLAPVLGRTVGYMINKGMPKTLQEFKRAVEEQK